MMIEQKEGSMSYPIGTRVRVRIEATAASQKYTGRSDVYLIGTTTEVTQTDGKALHYIYLGSDKVRRTDIPGGERQSDGATVLAEFEGIVEGDERNGPSLTTLVREAPTSERPGRSAHYLYLDASSVTVIDGFTPEPEKPAARRFAKGTKVRVNISGTKTSGEQGDMSICSTVVDDTAERWTHFLYFGSSRVNTDDADGKVHAQFDAVVTGDFGKRRGPTTQVDELSPEGARICTHYLYLESGDIQVIREDGTVEGEEAKPEPESKRITRGEAAIESLDVLKRIYALTSPAGGLKLRFTVTRNRNGQVIENPYDLDSQFGSAAAAQDYLRAKDYDLDRFTISSRALLAEEDRSELEKLQKLNDAGVRQFSGAWYTPGVRIRRDDVFTADWAREKTRELLGVTADLDNDWPWTQIDWADATQDYLDSKYLSLNFDGALYWAEPKVNDTTE